MKDWPIILEPTTLPFLWRSCPLALSWKNTCARPVIASGYRTPNMTVVTNVNHRATSRFFFISSSNNAKIRQQYIDEFDSYKRSDNSTYTVDQKVASQQSGRTKR